MIEVTCPKCNKNFKSEQPQIDIIMKCPYCSANLKLKGYTNPLNALPSASEVVKKVQTYEKLLNILWIIVGVYQVLLGLKFNNYILIILGIYNACMTINGFRSIKNIYIKNQNVIPWYDKRLIPTILFLFVNLIFGGILGCFLCGFNLYIRYYVLKHKYAFE